MSDTDGYEGGDEATESAGDSPDADTETVTIPVPVALDDVHRPAWKHLTATAPDEQAAREQLGEAIAAQFEVQVVIYQQYQQVQQQRSQLAGALGAALADGGEGESEDTDG